MLSQHQHPAVPERATRHGDAQLQLVRRYAKLLRESASAARAISTQPAQGVTSRRSSTPDGVISE